MLASGSTDRSLSVLIIDDDEDDYLLICDLLQDLVGDLFEITWESAYESGLARLDRDRFDVCLAGYYIGGQTGTEFVRAATDLTTACPIILLSGVSHHGIEKIAADLGAAGFLSKSNLTLDKVKRSIDGAIAASRGRFSS